MPPRIIVNGKAAGRADLREAIDLTRASQGGLQVRSTFESGDVHRLVDEAIADGVKRLLIGGGDGSVNEVFDALLRHPAEQRPELGIVPLGSANDLACACEIPTDPAAALALACEGQAHAVDAIRANERIVANVATAGFGAQVTAETPAELKNFLGGGAYTLMGMIKALGFKPYHGRIVHSDFELEGKSIIGAICNGRLAGGGQPLAPAAKLNDGLMDVLLVLDFPTTDINVVIREALDPEVDGRYVKRFQARELEVHSTDSMPCNLDGEPFQAEVIRFSVEASAINLVLPAQCPCI